MAKNEKKDVAARVLKVLSLLLLIAMAVVSFLLLFTLLPMLFLDGNVQLDPGGFLDLLLRPTTHGAGIISAKLIFFGALPLLADALLLLVYAIVLFSFLRQVTRRGTWFFAAGKTRWIVMTVLGALTAAVPFALSKAVTPTVAASGTFAVKPWNPLGGIALFVLTLAITVLYTVKTNRRLPLQVNAARSETEEGADA